MAYTEDQVLARISTALNDTGTLTWGTAEIRAHMDQALRELSDYLPHTARGTVTFASGTVKELSLTGLSNLLDEDGIDIEYEIDKDPKRWRNFQVRNSTAYVDITFWPSSGDTAYIYYPTIHALSGTGTNTMDVREERLLIEMTAGIAAMSKASTIYQQVFSAISDLGSAGTAIDNVTGRINAATADMGSARAQLNLMAALVLQGGTIVGQMAAEVSSATAYLASGGTAAGLMPALILAAGTAIGNINARIQQATVDIGSARIEALKAGTAIASAGSEVALMNPQVDLATAAINSGSAIVNTVPVGGGAPEWAGQAAADIGAGIAFAQTGAAYLQEAQTGNNVANTHLNDGLRELSAASAYYQHGRALLEQATTDGSVNQQYLALALREFEAANAKLRNAQGYFEQAAVDARTGEAYGTLAIRELGAGGAYLNQSGGYLKRLESRLRTSGAGRDLERWGTGKYQKALGELRAMAKPKRYTRWPTVS